MEIILREDVQHLGKAGEVVKVRDGYARNYLLPHGLAYPATDGNKKRIVFEAERVAKQVGAEGFDVARIHGNRSQNQRQLALAGFKSGQHQVLVATDVASRGIDVEGISHVVNYDVPAAATDYSQTAIDAFLRGRAIIHAAGDTLTESELADLEAERDALAGAWERAVAATVVHYLLRTRDVIRDEGEVSPRMLYDMARRYDEWPGEKYSGSSARGAMKGWHKHGVCSRAHWTYDRKAEPQNRRLFPRRFEDALRKSLKELSRA